MDPRFASAMRLIATTLSSLLRISPSWISLTSRSLFRIRVFLHTTGIGAVSLLSCVKRILLLVAFVVSCSEILGSLSAM